MDRELSITPALPTLPARPPNHPLGDGYLAFARRARLLELGAVSHAALALHLDILGPEVCVFAVAPAKLTVGLGPLALV